MVEMHRAGEIAREAPPRRSRAMIPGPGGRSPAFDVSKFADMIASLDSLT